ncbi:MAG: beta strand repeat-containing protein, partial [Novosphingobium sp.]
LPEGKSFVIGTLGSGTGQTGTFGATGTGTNTATLLGNPKFAAGQLLAGFNGGDINIHANAATDTATLNLSTRNVGDTLVLGDGVTAANNVVITPTYGDSGATSAVTLLQMRTGGTTLNKIGLGTLEIRGVNFTNTDGTDARAGFTLNVNAGMLKYTQVDSGTGANFAAVNVSNATMEVTGSLIGTTPTSVMVNTGGTLLLDYGTNASVLSNLSALTLGGGTLQLKGRTGAFTTAQTLDSLSLTDDTGSSISLNPNGGTSTTLTITSDTITTGTGASVNFNLSGGTTNASTGTLGNTIVAWNPALTSGIIGGTYTVTDIGGTGFATVSAGQVVRLADPGSAGLPRSAGSGVTNYFVNSAYSTSNPALAGSLVEALSGNVLANTVTVDTTGLAAGANLALGTNKLTLTIGGGMVFSGANPYTISGTTNGITGSAAGTIILNNYITSPSGLDISAPITNTTASATAVTAVTFYGTGTTRLSSTASNYRGFTTVNGGILEVTANNALGTNARGTSVTAGATLRLTGVTYSTTEALTINGTGAGGTAGALANSGTSTFAGPITALTSATINAGGGTLNLTGGLVKNGTTLTFTGGGSINISNVGISGTLASSALVVDGTTVTGNVLNTYVGATTISNGGTLNANIAGALPAGTRSAVSFTGTGTSTLSLGAGQVVASLTSAGAATVTLCTNTLTVGTASGSTTFTGSIGGAGNLIKDGASTQVLSGTNDYTGTTTVNGGTLLLDSETSTSVLSNLSALTLGGGTLQLQGKTIGDTAQTLASLSLTAGTASSISLVPIAGNTTTLIIASPTITTGAGAGVNFNYTAGSTIGDALEDNYVAWNPTLTNGIIGGTYTVTDKGGTGFATVFLGVVVRLVNPGSAGLPLNTGSGTTNYFVNSAYSTSDTALAGSLVETLSGNVLANTVTVSTTGL